MTGPALAYGDTVLGEINPAGDMDFYTFEGKAGDMVLITATETGEQSSTQLWFDIQVEVLDPGRQSIAKGDAGFNNRLVRLTFALATDGRYTLLVQEPSGVSFGPHTGPYTLALNKVSQGVGASLNYGDVATGEIKPAGDVDAYAFEGRETDIALVVVTSASTGGVSPLVEVFDPRGKPLARGDSSPMVRLTVALTVTGRYSITVQNGHGDTGTYTILLKNVASAAGSTLVYGDVVQAQIQPPGDVDVYTFAGKAGDVAWIAGTETAGDAWLQVEVFDPQGKSLAKADAPMARTTVPLTTNGTYRVLVQQPSARTGPYTLSLKNVA